MVQHRHGLPLFHDEPRTVAGPGLVRGGAGAAQSEASASLSVLEGRITLSAFSSTGW